MHEKQLIFTFFLISNLYLIPLWHTPDRSIRSSSPESNNTYEIVKVASWYLAFINSFYLWVFDLDKMLDEWLIYFSLKIAKDCHWPFYGKTKSWYEILVQPSFFTDNFGSLRQFCILRTMFYTILDLWDNFGSVKQLWIPRTIFWSLRQFWTPLDCIIPSEHTYLQGLRLIIISPIIWVMLQDDIRIISPVDRAPIIKVNLEVLCDWKLKIEKGQDFLDI